MSTTKTTLLSRVVRSKSPVFGDDSAVVYDPLNRTLFQGRSGALEGKLATNKCIKVPIENCCTKVDIKIPLSSSNAQHPNPDISNRPTSTSESGTTADSDNTAANAAIKIYLATVDLGKLGRHVRNGVKEGRIKDVYVLGYVPEGGQMIGDAGMEG